jgi:signal transduction histidine kinase
LLVAGQGDQSASRLIPLLRDDPPLLLWTVCRAGQQPPTSLAASTAAGGSRRFDAPPPAAPLRSVAEAAHWLAQHALEVLQWPEGQYAAGEGRQPREVCADRVAAAVAAAALAVHLAAGRNQDERDQAELSGLLHQAQQWFEGCEARGTSAAATPPLASPFPLPSLVLQSHGPQPVGVDDTYHRQGAEAGRRWLAEVHGPADWLPQLAAKLARLAELEQSFLATLEREKLTALAEFAAGAGHEINNPLTVIAGRAQLFLQEERDPERRRALALINAQAMRVYEMIADLRLFARPPRPEMQPVDLSQLVDRLVAELSPSALQQGISLGREGDGGPLEISADPTQLMVALRALCQNAVEALGSQGHIWIELRRSAGGARIRVRDDGPGISPQARTHIFDPFYSARQAGRGLGLGLSKCWRIVTNHGGRMEVESRPGEGAAFTIILPEGRRKGTGPCFRPAACPSAASFGRKMDQSPAAPPE